MTATHAYHERDDENDEHKSEEPLPYPEGHGNQSQKCPKRITRDGSHHVFECVTGKVAIGSSSTQHAVASLCRPRQSWSDQIGKERLVIVACQKAR